MLISRVAGSVLLLLATFGCQSDEADTSHFDGEGGVLSISSGGGGFVMEPPNKKVATWWGTWGSYQLCVTEPGKTVTITGYRLNAEIEPLEAYIGIRTIDPKLYENATRRKRDALATIAAANGQPLQFRGSGGPPAAGRFAKGIQDVEVSMSCDETEAFGLRSHHPLQELMVVMKSGPKGVLVPSMEVDYTVDGKDMTLKTRWEMGMCGTQLKESRPQDCSF